MQPVARWSSGRVYIDMWSGNLYIISGSVHCCGRDPASKLGCFPGRVQTRDCRQNLGGTPVRVYATTGRGVLPPMPTAIATSLLKYAGCNAGLDDPFFAAPLINDAVHYVESSRPHNVLEQNKKKLLENRGPRI